MADFPKIQGAHASWANFKIKIKGTDFEFETADLASIEWKDSVDIGTVRGQGPGKRGRTEGEYDAEAKMALFRDAYRQFIQALAQVNPKITLVEFDIQGYWQPYNDSDETLEVRIVSARLQERETSMAPGSEATMVNLPLNVMKIYEDGVCLIGDD